MSIMEKQYSYTFILSLQKHFTNKIDSLDNFIKNYELIIKEDNVQPLFSKTSKYDMFPKKKAYKRFNSKSKWKPEIPKNDIDKMKKTIKTIINKISDKNYNILIETLICEIKKFKTVNILETLVEEITKIIMNDQKFHDLYFKICEKITNLTDWHENLITIILDENSNFYWYENIIDDKDPKLNGPFENEHIIRIHTNKYINFKYYLANHLQKQFNLRDEFISKSKTDDDDVRYKNRSKFFNIVKFIGKLYKKKYLNEYVIHQVIQTLLLYKTNDKPPAEYVEAFTLLWTIIDGKFFAPFRQMYVYQYFDYLENVIFKQDWEIRLEFMIEGVIDDYKEKYKPNDDKKLDVNKQNNDIEKKHQQISSPTRSKSLTRPTRKNKRSPKMKNIKDKDGFILAGSGRKSRRYK